MKPSIVMVSLAALAWAMPTGAQEKFPSKPIQILTTSGSGTGVDVVARLISERLAPRLGQPVLVQNRQGAGGTIATQALAKSGADGYTILATSASHSINPWIYRTLSYDTLRDFAGVALVGETPMTVTVSAQLGVRSLKEFIALAKQKPGAINFGSAGIGSATHLAGEYFATRAGVKLVHVPYRSTPDLYGDLMTDRIQAVFAPLASTMPTLRTGKALALAVTSRKSIQNPMVLPTVSDEAIPGYEYSQWFGFIASAAVPAPILEQLARAIQAVGDEKDMREKLEEQGIQPRVLVLRDFDAFIKADVDKLGQIAKGAGITAN